MEQPAIHMTEQKTGIAAVLHAFKTILWAFIGLRKRQSHEKTVTGLRVWHYVVAIFICAAAFIVGLITLARSIVH